MSSYVYETMCQGLVDINIYDTFCRRKDKDHYVHVSLLYLEEQVK